MEKDDPNLDELMGGGHAEQPIAASPQPDTDDELEALFTEEELAEIEREADERVYNALREAERERLIAKRMQARKREEGQRTGISDMDEKVEIYIDLPEFAASLRVNNEEFFHGYRYVVPRHVYNSLREMMQRAQQHQDIADGKDLAAQYRGRDRHGKELSAPILSGGEKV